MEDSEAKIENDANQQTEKLISLIEQDAHTKSLTVAVMALRDLAEGRIDSALLRLKVDLDKIVHTNRELSSYVLELLDKRNLWGKGI